eukprot:SAG22_NODE_231_length_14551_cov_22.298090_7_plen_197_part_00
MCFSAFPCGSTALTEDRCNQRAAEVFNTLCDASTPGASSVQVCQHGSGSGSGRRRRQQQLASVSFVFVATSFGQYIDDLISYKEYQVDQMADRLVSLHASRCSEAGSSCGGAGGGGGCTPHACGHTDASFRCGVSHRLSVVLPLSFYLIQCLSVLDSCVEETFGTPSGCVAGCGDTVAGRAVDLGQSTLLYSASES